MAVIKIKGIETEWSDINEFFEYLMTNDLKYHDFEVISYSKKDEEKVNIKVNPRLSF